MLEAQLPAGSGAAGPASRSAGPAAAWQLPTVCSQKCVSWAGGAVQSIWKCASNCFLPGVDSLPIGAFTRRASSQPGFLASSLCFSHRSSVSFCRAMQVFPLSPECRGEGTSSQSHDLAHRKSLQSRFPSMPPEQTNISKGWPFEIVLCISTIALLRVWFLRFYRGTSRTLSNCDKALWRQFFAIPTHMNNCERRNASCLLLWFWARFLHSVLSVVCYSVARILDERRHRENARSHRRGICSCPKKAGGQSYRR